MNDTMQEFCEALAADFPEWRPVISRKDRIAVDGLALYRFLTTQIEWFDGEIPHVDALAAKLEGDPEPEPRSGRCDTCGDVVKGDPWPEHCKCGASTAYTV